MPCPALGEGAAEHAEPESGAARPCRPPWLLDVCLGMLLPIFCLVADPIVFRVHGIFAGRPPGFVELRGYKVFVYGATALSVVGLALWLVLERRPGWWSAVLCGAMSVAGLVAGAIGIMILHLTILGLSFFLIGALGLTPFATCWLYLRDAARAFRSSRSQLRRPAFAALFLAGALVVTTPPAAAQWWVSDVVPASIAAVLSGRNDPDRAVQRLARVHSWVEVDLTPLLRDYEDGEVVGDPSRRERIARAYRAITGEDIAPAARRQLD